MATLTKGVTTIDIGRVNTEQTDLTNGITTMPIPLEESSETRLFDFSGKVRKITISGTFTGTMSELNDFTDGVDAFVNEGQEEEDVRYVGNAGTKYAAGLDGVLMRWNYTYSGGIMTRISYTFEFVEGTIITKG